MNWHVKGDPLAQDLPTYIIHKDEQDNGVLVAQVFGGSRDRPFNAALIALAPEILDTLEALMDFQNGPPLPTYTDHWEDAMSRGNHIRSILGDIRMKETPKEKEDAG